MGYRVITNSEAKKIFFENEKTGEKGMMVHASVFITLKHNSGAMVCFKITKRGNHYDSRDKGKKTVTKEFVQSELHRMLGHTEGARAYQNALRDLACAF